MTYVITQSCCIDAECFELCMYPDAEYPLPYTVKAFTIMSSTSPDA